ncbi:MAG: exodeoxyribonuclease VII small subunit [Rhodospirillales bacterium]|nr:exodeoxyribonuclease VII small subunit [Rhodospirillales bacterium]MDH3791097.1 exodeoxyribonuclease VII small subunit [Rhodospirillales bacterium]MDH3910271.1 exodeoxyribonuclease VII small subunit [Rhodospirillales bacterium]MDH3917178.1 exodeoxyribonuclease VII small subunit [Rhodospirillales bacterium]MDH3969399.1 exodeoxyribonuclease VII small subunit [Rhodospirillales bacterium]
MAEGKLPADIRAMNFEDALQELQQIVGQLEKGEGKLDQAIEAYKRGAALKQHCENKLREAKQQIDKITLGPGGEAKTEPFEVD